MGAGYRNSPRIIASTVVAVGWPITLLASGYVGYQLANELAAKCSPITHLIGEVWLVGLLSGVIFLLSVLPVFIGRSPWRIIDPIRTILLTAVTLWVGASGMLFLALTFAFSEHDMAPHARTWLAIPAIVPLIQTLGGVSVLRFTTRWTRSRRVSLLAGVTLGIPLLSIGIASSGFASC